MPQHSAVREPTPPLCRFWASAGFRPSSLSSSLSAPACVDLPIATLAEKNTEFNYAGQHFNSRTKSPCSSWSLLPPCLCTLQLPNGGSKASAKSNPETASCPLMETGSSESSNVCAYLPRVWLRAEWMTWPLWFFISSQLSSLNILLIAFFSILLCEMFECCSVQTLL